MKRFSLAILVALGLAACLGAPTASLADEIPMEKASNGTWSVEYAGQHFKIVSTASVKVRFEFLSATQIRLTFVSEFGVTGKVSVYWVEFQKYIYSGPIPTSEPWGGILNTEGGFVDR